jgi:hypothetical protein
VFLTLLDGKCRLANLDKDTFRVMFPINDSVAADAPLDKTDITQWTSDPLSPNLYSFNRRPLLERILDVFVPEHKEKARNYLKKDTITALQSIMTQTLGKGKVFIKKYFISK